MFLRSDTKYSDISRMLAHVCFFAFALDYVLFLVKVQKESRKDLHKMTMCSTDRIGGTHCGYHHLFVLVIYASQIQTLNTR